MDDATRLLLAARDGRADVFDGVVRLTQPDVWRFCAYLSSPAEADDLTQDTYLRAFRALGRYRGEAPARSWLLSIARHAVADHIRAKERRRRIMSRLTATPPPGVADDASGRVALWDLVAQLDDDRRAAFVLTQLLGLSYAEAATVCGCEVGTIRSRVSRARERLVAAHDLPESAAE